MMRVQVVSGSIGMKNRLLGLRLSLLQPLFFGLLALLAFPGMTPVAAQQAKLPVEAVSIRIADGTEYLFKTEMALTPEQQAQGMMLRTEMAPDEGMLFVFPEPRRASFWMRNTLIPLDMLFVRQNGRVVNIIENAKPQTDTPRRSNGRVKAVLELPGGRAAELGIKPGDLVIHPSFGG